MQVKLMAENNPGQTAAEASDICFGLDRATDEHSLKLFLGKIADPVLLDLLLPRLSDLEVHATVDFLTGLLHRHLSKQEYHKLLLKDID
jgi:hypothetical protein